jgi:nicotinate-nucleotide adenylyltransferase
MTTTMVERIGVLGGTFDPVHYGHLRCAEEVREVLELDRVIFIPAASPPHKFEGTILDFEHRWEMLKKAIEDHPFFEASDLEMRLPGKSYTAVTLRRLHEVFTERPRLFFLLGMDAFLELNTWWRYRDLFCLASLVVLRRPGHLEERVLEFLKDHVSMSYSFQARGGVFTHPELLPVYTVKNTYLEISSTQIRRLVAQGKSIRYLAPREVLSYIAENRLYGYMPMDRG